MYTYQSVFLPDYPPCISIVCPRFCVQLGSPSYGVLIIFFRNLKLKCSQTNWFVKFNNFLFKLPTVVLVCEDSNPLHNSSVVPVTNWCIELCTPTHQSNRLRMKTLKKHHQVLSVIYFTFRTAKWPMEDLIPASVCGATRWQWGDSYLWWVTGAAPSLPITGGVSIAGQVNIHLILIYHLHFWIIQDISI